MDTDFSDLSSIHQASVLSQTYASGGAASTSSSLVQAGVDMRPKEAKEIHLTYTFVNGELEEQNFPLITELGTCTRGCWKASSPHCGADGLCGNGMSREADQGEEERKTERHRETDTRLVTQAASLDSTTPDLPQLGGSVGSKTPSHSEGLSWISVRRHRKNLDRFM